MTIIDQYSKLKEQVAAHSRRYHVQDNPLITDAEYDVLFRELQNIETEHPELDRSDSPTQRVGGAPLAAFAEVRHLRRMLSIDNAMNGAEAAAFVASVGDQLGIAKEEVEFCAELKYDGASSSLVYKFGVLAQAATRGDGETGEDVTAQVRTIRNVPLRISNLAPRVEVRGEVVITNADFERVNAAQDAKGDKRFANPRNAAAGGLRNLDPKVTAARRLSFLAYSFGECHGYLPAGTQFEQLKTLVAEGFEISDTVKVVTGVDGVQAHFEQIQEARSALPFEIDGVVFKVNATRYQDQLGWNSRTPRWAIAFKFPPQEATTKCVGIETQVGRTGKVTPVAKLAPVYVGGVTVTSATLHNEDEARRKDVRVGDTVVVRRAGDVIPEIVRPVFDLRTGDETPYTAPTTCPVCGAAVHREEDSSDHRCTGGLKCPAQRLFAITHFASRLAMNIDGLGEGIVEKLLTAKLLERPSGIFALQAGDIEVLPGMGKASAAKLLNAVVEVKQPELNRFIYALGIPGVGEATAKDLAKRFKSFAAFQAADLEALLAVPDVGPTTAGNVLAFFANQDNVDEVNRLQVFVGPKEVEAGAANAAILDKTFVITGTLANPREAYKALIESAGGKVAGSVSKKTHYLLAGSEAGTKLAKAQELNVTILDEAAFEALLAG